MEPSRTEPGTAWAAFDRHMFDDYKRVAQVFTPAERRALFHDNAARFYRL